MFVQCQSLGGILHWHGLSVNEVLTRLHVEKASLKKDKYCFSRQSNGDASMPMQMQELAQLHDKDKW